MAGCIWVAGYVGVFMCAVCCAIPNILRVNLRAERRATGRLIQNSQSVPASDGDQPEVCTIAPSGNIESKACRRFNRTDSLYFSHSGVCQSAAGCSEIAVPCLSLMAQAVTCKCFVHEPTTKGAIMLLSFKPAPDILWGWEPQLAAGLMIAASSAALLHLACQICRLLNLVRAADVVSSGTALLRVASQIIVECILGWKATKRHSDRVWELVTKKRLRRAEKLLQGLMVILYTGTFSTALRMFRDPVEMSSMLYESPLVVCVVPLILLLPYQLKFQAVSPLLMDGLNVALSAVWVWRYLTLGYVRNLQARSFLWEEPVGYLYFAGMSMNFRIMQGFICGRARLSIVLNVLMTIVDVHAFSLLGHNAGAAPMSDANQRCIFLLMIVTLIIGDESQLVAEAAALVDAETSSSNHTMVHRALEATCDVVACLDADLSFIAPCPKLAHMLLKHPHSAADGCGFIKFVSPDDRDRLHSHLENEVKMVIEHPTKLDPASTLHLHMVNVDDKKVPVQLYCCCAMQPGGQTKHLIGITERGGELAQDATAPQGLIHARSSLCSLVEKEAQRFDADDMTNGTVVGRSVGSNQESGTSASPLDSTTEGVMEKEVRVSIDAASADLAFLQCSSAFACLSGAHGIGGGLRGWLRRKMATRFLSWLSSADLDPGCCEVNLRPPGLQRGCYRARCHLASRRLEPRAAHAGNIAVDVVDLVFDDVHFVVKPRKARWNLQPSGSLARLHVRIADLTILGADFSESTNRLHSGWKVGGSFQTCLVDHMAFTNIIRTSAEAMSHGTRRADQALDLGLWKLVSEERLGLSEECFGRLTLAGFDFPSTQTHHGGLTCWLDVRFPGVAGALSVGSERADTETQEIRVVLGNNGNLYDLLIMKPSDPLRLLFGFDVEGHSFALWLEDPFAFMSWAMSLSDFSENDIVPETALQWGEITLRPEGLSERGWEVRAICRCSTLPRDMEGSQADFLVISLSNARKVKFRFSL